VTQNKKYANKTIDSNIQVSFENKIMRWLEGNNYMFDLNYYVILSQVRNNFHMYNLKLYHLNSMKKSC